MGTPGDKANTQDVVTKIEEEDTDVSHESPLQIPFTVPVVQTTSAQSIPSTTTGMTVLTEFPHFSALGDYVTLPQTTEKSESVSLPNTNVNLEQATIEEYFAQSKYYPFASEALSPISILPRTTKTFLSAAEPGPSGLQPLKASKRIRKSHICSICQKVFQNATKLAKHQLIHNGKSPFKCEHCRKTFSSRFKLVRHILIHSDRKPFSCSVCDRTFHRKDHLKNHIKVHSPSKKHYVCEKPTCKKEYTSLLSFKKHTALHAAEDGSLECQICSKTFQTKDDILYHLKIHAGSRTVKNPNEKKFTCDYCERKFFTRKDVRRHLVVHTGMRDFLCQFCPQRFGRKDHLVRHIKKSHTRGLSSELGIKQEAVDPVKLEIDEEEIQSVKAEHTLDISNLPVGLFYQQQYGASIPSTSEQLHFLPNTPQTELKDLGPIILDEIAETSSIGSVSSAELIASGNIETPQLLEEPVLSDTEIMRLLQPTEEQNLPLPGFSQTFQTPPPPPPPKQ